MRLTHFSPSYTTIFASSYTYAKSIERSSTAKDYYGSKRVYFVAVFQRRPSAPTGPGRNQMEEWKVSISCKFERSLLSHEEYETISLTHHPAIYDVETAELEAMRPRLRKMRDKERTLGRQKRREGRGKAEARGASFPGTVEHASRRQQVFAAALKRVNNEIRRLHNLAARTAHVEAARKALALRRAANFITYPAAGATANEGMVPKASTHRRKIITGAKIGRVSQATKVAHAVRDARGA
jgi:hypothetical protein